VTISVAVLMGIVEGVTEFLPVSSTGHLILAGDLLGLSGPRAAAFEIVIQVGAILAVALLYWRRFLMLARPGTGGTFSGPRGIGLLLLTTLPGAALGFAAHGFIKSLFTPASVALALCAGGVCMLLLEARLATRPGRLASLDELGARHALGIGCFQCLALWPGFSRSAATIMGGMLLGLRRELAAEYSFIAAVPLLVGAAGYELATSLDLLGKADIPLFAAGAAVSFLAALATVKTFIAVLGRVTLRPFAVYRLLVAIPVYRFMVGGG
jgi:undecaprenyl-diphosphatase